MSRIDSEIKLIRAGKTGFGLLIENDAGYISPDDVRNKPFITEVKKLEHGGVVMAEPLKLFVVLQKYGVENRNGRIYPEHLLRREAERYQELINNNAAMGESDHPESSIISIDRISHNITKIWWEGKTLVGEIDIIMSPGFVRQGIISCEGDKIANLLRRGIRIGVSSRGVGSLQSIEGRDIVQDDFELICWDVVTSPSTPGSYIFNKSQDAQAFMESEVKKKPLLGDKLDKFLLG